MLVYRKKKEKLSKKSGRIDVKIFEAIRNFFAAFIKDYDAPVKKEKEKETNFEITREMLCKNVNIIFIKDLANIFNRGGNSIDILRAWTAGYEPQKNAYRLLACLNNIDLFLEWKNNLPKPQKIVEYAIMYENNDFAKILIDNYPEVFYNLFISYAVESDNIEIVKYLVEEKGASIMQYQCHPMRRAAEKGYNDIVKYFISRGCPPYACAHYSLKVACKQGNMSLIKYLVEECNCRVDLHRNYLVRNACNSEIKEYLVERGANPA